MEPILRAEKVTKRYGSSRLFGAPRAFQALNGISLSVRPRTTLALVGPSGSGKSTLALCLALLEPVTSGTVWFAGTETTVMSENELRQARPQIQLVFQDPATSLNPRFTALQLVLEPLNVQDRSLRNDQKIAKASELLQRVGIPGGSLHRKSNEFSGGQRQRIAIARALALCPQVVILDEPLSALDCSIQAQIINLLLDLQASLGLAYVFVSHDLAMAAHAADDIAVMADGIIVEAGPVESVMGAPQHEVTKRLLRASGHLPAQLKPAVL